MLGSCVFIGLVLFLTAAEPKPLPQETDRGHQIVTIVSIFPSAPWWPWGEAIGVNPSKIHQKKTQIGQGSEADS
jgi:hypothetical protein